MWGIYKYITDRSIINFLLNLLSLKTCISKPNSTSNILFWNSENSRNLTCWKGFRKKNCDWIIHSRVWIIVNFILYFHRPHPYFNNNRWHLPILQVTLLDNGVEMTFGKSIRTGFLQLAHNEPTVLHRKIIDPSSGMGRHTLYGFRSRITIFLQNN